MSAVTTSHTPGPWKWFDYPDGRKLLCASNRAVIHCPDAPLTIEPADQALIGAAPGLLVLAKAHLEDLRCLAGMTDHYRFCDMCDRHIEGAVQHADDCQYGRALAIVDAAEGR